MSTTGTAIETQGALRGVRVVEFGQYIPGPLLGMLLAEQGADVIKVERPGGDPARSEPAFATWNRSKRSVELDLKTAKGQEKTQELVGWADVLIENYRPGVADRLGIGYQAAKHNSGLIYCSLPGFGEESPHRNDQGWEPIVSAATGAHQGVPGMDEPLFLPCPRPAASRQLSDQSRWPWPLSPASGPDEGSASRCRSTAPCSRPWAGTCPSSTTSILLTCSNCPGT